MSLQTAVFLKTSLQFHLLLWYLGVLKSTEHVTIKELLLIYAVFESYIPNVGKMLQTIFSKTVKAADHLKCFLAS